MCPKWNILILKLMFVVVALCFYDNRDNRNNGLILNSMLSVDNNKNNFYQPEGWLPLETCCPCCLCCLPKTASGLLCPCGCL